MPDAGDVLAGKGVITAGIQQHNIGGAHALLELAWA